MLADGSNAYLYGNGRIAQYDTAMQYFGGDALGSVRQLYSPNRQVLANTRYDPFGRVLAQSGTASSAYGFTGEWTDGTGLVHLRARYYSVQQGRFVTRDVWEGDPNAPMSYNAWLYVHANPVNLADPTGYDPYICDDPTDRSTCRRIHIYTGPTYSYTELMWLYFGVQPQANSFPGMPDPEWIQAHLHEWNGTWGWNAPGDEYKPSAAEDMVMTWAVLRKLGCGTQNLWLAVFAQVLGNAELPPLSRDEGPLSGVGALPGAKSQKGAGSKISTPSPEILGRNMQAKGVKRPSDTAAHHIVAGNDRRAAQARAILAREGIDINDADNGVFLPANTHVPNPPQMTHSTLNTKNYHEEVNRRLSNAPPGGARDVLRQIATELKDGTFPR